MDSLSRFNDQPSTKAAKPLYQTRYTVGDRRTIAATAKNTRPTPPKPCPRPGVPGAF